MTNEQYFARKRNTLQNIALKNTVEIQESSYKQGLNFFDSWWV